MANSSWWLVGAILQLIVSVCVAQEQLWKYALGYKDTSYTDYTAMLSVPDTDTADAIAAYYTGMGGLPSLGPPPTQENCDFVWNVGGEDTVTCNCGVLPVANDVASLEQDGQCFGSLSAEMLTSATPNTDGAVAIFESTLPSGCDPQCELHGACSETGTGCQCAPQANETSFYWTGDDCSEMQPGKGYAAYWATLTFSTLRSMENFVFSTRPDKDCFVYVSQMPMDSEFQGKYIPVTNVNFAPQYLSFGLETSPPDSDELVMKIYLYAPKNETLCWVGNIAGGTYTATTMQIAVEDAEAQTIGPNSIISLPSQRGRDNTNSIDKAVKSHLRKKRL